MSIDEARQIVMRVMGDALGGAEQVTDDTALIGEGAVLDSMQLVEVCLALEDEAEELGFAFDWMSENAMSRSRSMFRNVGALAAEFLRQSEQAK